MSGPQQTPPARKRVMVAAGGAGAAAAAVIALSGPMIDRFEGNVLATYVDPIGVLTACRGHTGPELKRGQRFSKSQCDRMFDADQRKVIARIGRYTKVDVPLESFAAFTSFSFNLGTDVYRLAIAPRVNRGDLAGACRALSFYTLARKPASKPCPGGSQLVMAKDGRAFCRLPGLVARRVKERAVCERGLS